MAEFDEVITDLPEDAILVDQAGLGKEIQTHGHKIWVISTQAWKGFWTSLTTKGKLAVVFTLKPCCCEGDWY